MGNKFIHGLNQSYPKWIPRCYYPGGINFPVWGDGGGQDRQQQRAGVLTGQSGLGKSTMVNTLFKSKVSRKASQPSQEERIPKTVQLQSVTHGKVSAMRFCPTNPGEKLGTRGGSETRDSASSPVPSSPMLGPH